MDLSRNSPRAATPPTALIPLKNHQQASLYRALALEKEEVAYDDNNFLKTQIGVLGDRVAAGKSYVILSLILSGHDHFIRPTTIYRSFANDKIVVIDRREDIASQVHPTSNLLVIPHNLVSQWVQYTKRFMPATSKVVVVKSTRQLDDANTFPDVMASDLTIVTSTIYNRFCRALGHELPDLTFARVFYDEADTVNLPACRTVPARFYWFVTASIENLLHPHGLTFRSNGVMIEKARGLRATGFIKDTFCSMINHAYITYNIIVRNNEEFVSESLHLPAIDEHVVRCKTSEMVRLLSGYVNRQVMQALHANDYRTAVQHLAPASKSTEESIISVLIDKLKNTAHNTSARITYIESMHYDNPAEKEAELKKLTDERSDLERKIKNISAQIQDADVCPICFDAFQNKTVTKCCHNSFCFGCISKWTGSKQQCPMCKAAVDISNMVVCVDEAEAESEASTSSASLDSTTGMSKLERAITLIKNRSPESRFLVLSQYDETFRALGEELREGEICHGFLKGNASVINNAVTKYRNGTMPVLLINPTHYGSGLNLENTTDIIMFHKFDNEMEKQIIGRAHRLGRTNALKVWYLLHDTE